MEKKVEGEEEVEKVKEEEEKGRGSRSGRMRLTELEITLKCSGVAWSQRCRDKQDQESHWR